MAEVNRVKALFIFNIILFLTFLAPVKALEFIRDTELEQFTDDVLKILLISSNLEAEDINVYFINSNQVNAFVTGGKNIFINTELIIEAEDYREYAAVIAHELAHILGGHIFRTSEELANISNKAMPIYLLGIIGLITGASEAGFAATGAQYSGDGTLLCCWGVVPVKGDGAGTDAGAGAGRGAAAAGSPREGGGRRPADLHRAEARGPLPPRLDARRRAGHKLRLFVVQRFGVRAAALGDGHPLQQLAARSRP